MDQEIRDFYAQGFEEERLRVGGNGRLEFLRTQEIVRRFVGGRARVLDVGGATGVHAGGWRRTGTTWSSSTPCRRTWRWPARCPG